MFGFWFFPNDGNVVEEGFPLRDWYESHAQHYFYEVVNVPT